jgi:hypothetical protein
LCTVNIQAKYHYLTYLSANLQDSRATMTPPVQ